MAQYPCKAVILHTFGVQVKDVVYKFTSCTLKSLYPETWSPKPCHPDSLDPKSFEPGLEPERPTTYDSETNTP